MESQFEVTIHQFRSGICGTKPEDGFGFSSHHSQSENGGNSSFTALLELPPPQAVELLVNEGFPAKSPPPLFPTNEVLVDRASKLSVFASGDNLLESCSIFSDSNLMKLDTVKQEPLDSDSHPKSSSPAVSNQTSKSYKRKKMEKKANELNRKAKKVAANENPDGGGAGEKLPYVHVRARRGQATDSHSLAERARREKINARMKLLQELVPGCSKISGTAMVLDEIINHVQALQSQVEFLSMKLAAVNLRSDLDFDSLLLAKEAEAVDGNMFIPSIWPEGQIRQPFWHFDTLQPHVWTREEDNSNFVTPESSMLTFHCSPNSGNGL